MAEMLIQSESLTSIADKIRVLSGTENAMGLDAMAEHVGKANDNVATEADLIAQIASTLEGKAAGGDSGSSGATIETCTVTLAGSYSNSLLILYTAFIDGVVQAKYATPDMLPLTNVICGSGIFYYQIGFMLSVSCNAGKVVRQGGTNLYYEAPCEAGITATITTVLD